MSAPTYRGGQGGAWQVAHRRGRVVLQFLRADAGEHPVFEAELTTDVAAQVAQALVRHAMAAGHGRPITLEIGGEG